MVWPFDKSSSITKPCKLNAGYANYWPRLWQRNLQEQKRTCDKISNLEQCAKCKLGVPSSLEAVAIDLGAETTVAALILFSTEDKGSTYTLCESSELGVEVGKVTGKKGKTETVTTREGALMAKFIVIRTGVDLKTKESKIYNSMVANDRGDDDKASRVCAQYSICVPVDTGKFDFQRVTDWSLDCVDVFCMACYIQTCNDKKEFKPSYHYIKTLFMGEHVHIVASGKVVL